MPLGCIWDADLDLECSYRAELGLLSAALGERAEGTMGIVRGVDATGFNRDSTDGKAIVAKFVGAAAGIYVDARGRRRGRGSSKCVLSSGETILPIAASSPPCHVIRLRRFSSISRGSLRGLGIGVLGLGLCTLPYSIPPPYGIDSRRFVSVHPPLGVGIPEVEKELRWWKFADVGVVKVDSLALLYTPRGVWGVDCGDCGGVVCL